MVETLQAPALTRVVEAPALVPAQTGYRFLYLVKSWNRWGMYSPEKLTEKLERAMALYTAQNGLPMPSEIKVIEDRPRAIARIQIVISSESGQSFASISEWAEEWQKHLSSLICLPEFGRSFCGHGFYQLSYENYGRV